MTTAFRVRGDDIKDARKEADHPQQSLPEDHPAHERSPEREKVTLGDGADHQPPRARAHTGDGPSAHHGPSVGRRGGSPGADGHNGPSTDNPGSSPDTPTHGGASGGDHDGPGVALGMTGQPRTQRGDCHR